MSNPIKGRKIFYEINIKNENRHISPVAWRKPPTNYGPWEQIVSSIDGLAGIGLDVTLFATKDSITRANLDAAVSYGYDKKQDAKVSECLKLIILWRKRIPLISFTTILIFYR